MTPNWVTLNQTKFQAIFCLLASASFFVSKAISWLRGHSGVLELMGLSSINTNLGTFSSNSNSLEGDLGGEGVPPWPSSHNSCSPLGRAIHSGVLAHVSGGGVDGHSAASPTSSPTYSPTSSPPLPHLLPQPLPELHLMFGDPQAPLNFPPHHRNRNPHPQPESYPLALPCHPQQENLQVQGLAPKQGDGQSIALYI